MNMQRQVIQTYGKTNLQALICGCGRSGTNYVSAVMNRDRKICGHEEVFSLYRDAPRVSYAFESSWYAAPLIPELPQETRILHIVRDPRQVMRSLHRIGMLARNPMINMLGGGGITNVLKICAAPRKSLHRYRFVMRHQQLVRNHTASFEHDSELKRLEVYWRDWNLLVENGAVQSGKPYLRVRLEDLNSQLVEISRFLGLDWDMTPLPPTNQKTSYAPRAMTFEPFDKATQALAERYGYDV